MPNITQMINTYKQNTINTYKSRVKAHEALIKAITLLLSDKWEVEVKLTLEPLLIVIKEPEINDITKGLFISKKV